MKPRLLLTAALTVALLSGCKKATPMGEAERAAFADRYNAEALAEEFPHAAEMLQHFQDTQEADYRLPCGLSMLHLACKEKDAELVNTLLAHHADINAVCTDTDSATPFLCAAEPDSRRETPEGTNELLDLLLSKGALGPQEMDNLVSMEIDEQVLLHLWDKGLRPSKDVADGAVSLTVFQNRPELLRRMLAEQYPIGDALFALVGAVEMGAEDWEEELEQLLEAGADPNACSPEGMTPLYEAATYLPDPAAEELIEQLMAHGADANVRIGGISAADFISKQPELAETLREKGYTLNTEPVELHPGAQLPQELRRMVLLEGDAAPYADLLETVLHEHSLDNEALGDALYLLTRANAARAGRVASDLMAEQPELVLSVAEALPQLCPDKAAVIAAARKFPEAAYELLPLLGRCNDADADIEALLSDADPAIQAGAWRAKLARAGLPGPEDGCVAAWLEERKLDPGCMSSAVVQALHLTSVSAYMGGEMDENEKKVFLRAFEDLYRPAAEALREAAADNSVPFRESDCYDPTMVAISRFIWEHRKAFLPNID